MSPELKAQLKEYLEDAQAKLDALPERIKAEAELAKEERRKPFPIVPLIEVSPGFMGPAIAAIGNAPDEVAESFGVVRATCAKQKAAFSMRCDQLVAILSLAELD